MDEITKWRIKEACDVVDVVGDYVALKRKGVDYNGLCPFHNDRHLGSFVVSKRKQMFNCFACGVKGDAITFIEKMHGVSYVKALEMLGERYGIIEGGGGRKTERVVKVRERMPLLVLDYEKYVSPTITRGYGGNMLVGWLRSLPWGETQRGRLETVLKQYAVGTSNEGHAIFWQIDERWRVRTGKMMLYRSDGHRDKETRGGFGWIHSRLYKAGIIDEEKVSMEQCLFGMHLLPRYEPKTVNIVESEKTALVCAVIYGQPREVLWMACGGKNGIKRETLRPLIERGVDVNLIPDIDAIAEWSLEAGRVGYDRLVVQSDFMRRNWTEADGEKADLCDVLIRLIGEDKREKKTETVRRIMEMHPYFGDFVKKLKLELL